MSERIIKKLSDAMFKSEYPVKKKWLDTMDDVLINQDANPDLIMVCMRECIDECIARGLVVSLVIGTAAAFTTWRICKLVKEEKREKKPKEEGA